MKRFLFLIFVLPVLGSCISFPFNSPESSSWASGDREKTNGTVKIVSVSAEKSGRWDSLEKEIKDLLPLLLLEEGYAAVPVSARADYSVRAAVREREYTDGWRTKRSLSVEIRLWADGSGAEHLPLSAGRALVQGNQSLASSKTLDALLRKAVKNSVRGLPAQNRSFPFDENAPRREDGR